MFFKAPLSNLYHGRKVKNVTKFKWYSSIHRKNIEEENRKLKKTILYVQQCALKENERNQNLLRFKFNVDTLNEKYKNLSNSEMDKVEISLRELYINLLRLSYLFNNICVNENEWVMFYLQVGEWNLIDVKHGKDVKKNKNMSVKENLVDENVYERGKYIIIILSENENYKKDIDMEHIERNIKNEYNLDSTYACYIFIHKILVKQIQNFLQMYSINNYTQILKGCQKIFHFFFQFHKKELKKLRFMYIYSPDSIFKENIKMLKNKSKVQLNTKQNNLHLNYYYDELYNYTFHKIFISSLYLANNVLDKIQFDTVEEKKYLQLIDFFWKITKHGIILEESILHLLHSYPLKGFHHYFPKNIFIRSFYKIVSITYFSKILNCLLIQNILNDITKRCLLFMYRTKEWSDIFFKLMKITGLNEHTFFIYKYCRSCFLNNNFSLEPAKVFDFFFVSSLIGIYDISLIHILLRFLKKEKYNNATTKNKIYYTLLGWNIILKKNVGNINKETNIELMLINYKNADTQFIYSTEPNIYKNLFRQINYYLSKYKKEVALRMKEKEHVNYLYNQYTILNILKKYYSDIKYEYITEHNFLVDVHLNIYKKDGSVQKVAIEYNGRTHYNLIDKRGIKDYQSKKLDMLENLNTIYKKWLLKNWNFLVISIPYFKWNLLSDQEKVQSLLHALNVEH